MNFNIFLVSIENKDENNTSLTIYDLTPDGVTRGSMVTVGIALSLGINVNGRHPQVCINDGGRP
jgi:hypothetical protein